MDTRKLSAAVGFLLLMGCIVAVVLVVYSGSSGRTSYKSSVEESWRKREMRMKERQDISSSVAPESPVQEAKLLADELQKLFMNKPGSANSAGSVKEEETGPKIRPSGTVKSLPPSKTPPFAMNFPMPELPNSPLPPIPEVNNRIFHHTQYNSERNPVEINPSMASEESQQSLTGDKGKNEFYPTAKIPSINPRLQKNVHGQMTSTNRNKNDILLVQSSLSSPEQRDPISRHASTLMSSTIFPASASNVSHSDKDPGRDGFSPSLSSTPDRADWDIEDDDMLLLDDYEQQYLLDEEMDSRDPLKAMGNVVQLITDIYKRGTQGLDVNGFLKVINETVQRGNNNGLLSQLNQFYRRPGNWSTSLAPDSVAVGRNVVESSLSAFVFMSFGVFLLNQIHNFLGTDKSRGDARQGRNLDSNGLEESDLDFLFEPPLHSLNTSGTGETFISTTAYSQGNPTDKKDGEPRGSNETENANSGFPSGEHYNTSDYVNNMFRAALNLVNAYTKDSHALECIWSKYCQDLDKTSAERGSLYSLAARINSIGLRLIMGQIPAELTVDVMLRSLLGWDGLPCMKMFPKCQVKEGTMRLQVQQGISENHSLAQIT